MFKTKSGRVISYYGAGNNDITAISKVYNGINTLDDLFEVLLECWCKETAYPSCQKDYEYENDPTYGQCAITAMLVNDIFGGTIHKIRTNGGTHYFNKINGKYVDLTNDQFELYDIPLSYESNQSIDRIYCGKSIDTNNRYSILKDRLNSKCNQKLTKNN